MRTYQNYHRHTNLTNPVIADSIVTNEDYAKRAVELTHGIISTCEHGYQGRHIEGYNLSRKYGLKFVMSAEAYWVKDRRESDGTNCHIFIAAKNEHGRQELNEALSRANEDGFYKRPRLDHELIMNLPADDVIVTTACVAFWKYPDVDAFVEEMRDHFKYFYLEVQYHNTSKQRDVNRHIIELHNKLRIPLIMGCDSHYIYPNQANDRDDFLKAREIFYEDEQGWFLDYPDGDTAYDRFAEQCVLKHGDIEDAIANTNIFLDVEEYDSPVYDSKIKVPTIFPGYTQEQKDAEYRRRVWAGFEEYLPSIPPEKVELYKQEIEKEIKAVEETGMSDYFLINYDVIHKGIENGGWLTQTGRGSAVSFITNMLLGFTKVDRIAASVKMFPDRFMSAERILQSGSLPDIDFNVADPAPFALAQKQILGEDHAYPMIAYGTLKKSAAWKLYAKSQNINFDVANAISAQLKKYEEELKQLDEDDKDSISVYDFIDKPYHELFRKSVDYQGIVSSWSIAPCSYLLYSGSIRREIGLVRVSQQMCCLMDGHWAEDGHFLKNDLLRVRVVEIIYKTYQRIGMKPHSVNELLALCKPDDIAWDIYRKQCLLGINQVERPGTAPRVAKYAPTNISELCAFVAAIRPGFKTMYKTFESREPFSYGVPSFDALIQTPEMPNSFVLYQEHVMAALNYAGISMSDAYSAIKAISKKRAAQVMSYRDRFVEGFSQRLMENEGAEKEQAEETSHRVWQIIEDSSRYSFNASHAYCVALDSLYGAWLKAHYPLEYYESYMQVQDDKGNKEKLSAAKEEAIAYFRIQFPMPKFGQDNRRISIIEGQRALSTSISSIKGFGAGVGQSLYELGCEHPRTLTDLLVGLAERGIKKARTEILAKIGYFSPYCSERAAFHMIELLEKYKYCTANSYPREDVDKSKVFRGIIERYCTGSTSNGKVSTRYTVCFDELPQLKAKKSELRAKAKRATPEDAERYEQEAREVDEAIASNIKRINLYIWREYEAELLKRRLPPLSLKTQIQNQYEIMGAFDLTTNDEADRRKLIITDVVELRTKEQKKLWGYAIRTKSIGSGKTGRFTMMESVYREEPLHKFDVIYIPPDGWAQNAKGYFYINKYQKIE